MLRTYADVERAISSGDTVVSILESYLAAIQKNKHLNAFLEVFEESALEQAKKIDFPPNRVPVYIGSASINLDTIGIYRCRQAQPEARAELNLAVWPRSALPSAPSSGSASVAGSTQGQHGHTPSGASSIGGGGRPRAPAPHTPPSPRFAEIICDK